MNHELKPGFTEEDVKRGEELLYVVRDGLIDLRREGFSKKELKTFLKAVLREIE